MQMSFLALQSAEEREAEVVSPIWMSGRRYNFRHVHKPCPLPPIPPGCHCFKLESPFQFLFLLLLLVVIAISQSRSLKGGSTNWFDNRKGRVGRTAVLPSSNRPDFTTTPPPGDNTQHVPPMKILFGQGIQHVSMPCRWSTIVRPHVCQLDFAFSNKLMKVLPFSLHAYC